jgi:hypothetical protein
VRGSGGALVVLGAWLGVIGVTGVSA